MTVLMRARELVGRPVVTLDRADDVAEVKDVLFSHAHGAVVGFTLNKRGMLGGPMGELLPISRLSSLGRDALMIADAGALGPDDEATAGARSSGQANVIGAAVTTDGGKELGTVVDVIVEVDDARRSADVIGFEMHGPGVKRDRDTATLLLPVDDTIAVSGQALIVPAAAEGFVRDDLSGFGSAVAEFRARLEAGR